MYAIRSYYENNKISVAQVYKDSPAQLAGVLPGDILVGVDGLNTVGMDYIKVVDMVKGEEGTEVVVTFERDGETIDFTMTRAKIIAEQCEWFMAEDNIGYIKIHVITSYSIHYTKLYELDYKENSQKDIYVSEATKLLRRLSYNFV